MTPLDLVLAGGGGFVAGGVNALAGGGTLISFPILIALGIPPVAANVTNTVALSPGYLGGAIAQRGTIAAQSRRVRRLSIAAAAGGLIGSILLLLTSDSAFKNLIPVLLLVATVLLATQDRIRSVLKIGQRSTDGSDDASDPPWLVVPVLAVSIYGGYFGAGLGIMLLAVLGIVLQEPLPRLNALKQALAFVINATAALFFLTSHKVYWLVALVMAVTSLVGGSVGGRLAGSVKPERLRAIVVTIGLAVAVVYAFKTWL
jgi:uncharacterized membrane protein YfcA